MHIKQSGVFKTWRHELSCNCGAELEITADDLLWENREYLDPRYWIVCPECKQEIEISLTDIPSDLVRINKNKS